MLPEGNLFAEAEALCAFTPQAAIAALMIITIGILLAQFIRRER